MAGVSDKARHYLEQSVPQLRDFEEKAIFSKVRIPFINHLEKDIDTDPVKDDIRKLVKKRSDFEHKVLARGSKPVDFARYAAWEMNLEHLRAKRCKRLKITTSSSRAGNARIFSIFDRGTRKHPGDLSLWISYLDFARQVGATNKFRMILTAAIRLHCTNPSLWLYAAKWSLDIEADMNGARSYMQRGIRFCTNNREMWIEYAKLEMFYLAKISTRRQILGIDRPRLTAPNDRNITDSSGDLNFDVSEDMVEVPDLETLTQVKTLEEVGDLDNQSTKDPIMTPIFNGAIPVAIFDHTIKQPFYNSTVAEQFFDMFSAFREVAALPHVTQHVVDCMMEQFPADPSTWSCFTKQPTIGVSPLSADFPTALLQSIERLKASFGKVDNKARFSDLMRVWMNSILDLQGLDLGIVQVLRFQVRKLHGHES